MLANAQDLSFKAVQKSAHKRLSAAEVQQYNTDGFCQPFDIFGPSEIAEIREYVDGLMADMGDAGSYGINCYQARLSGIYDIATVRTSCAGRPRSCRRSRMTPSACLGTKMQASGSSTLPAPSLFGSRATMRTRPIPPCGLFRARIPWARCLNPSAAKGPFFIKGRQTPKRWARPLPIR